MVFAKAFAVGIVTGVLAPVVLAAASYLNVLSGFSRGYYYLHPGGYAGGSGFYVSVGLVDFSFASSPERLITQLGVGFAVGFLFMLWRALVRRQVQ